MVHDSKLARGESDFAADRLREQFGRKIFLVHRLDRATSGCLLLAFDRDSASALGKTLMSREVAKHYLAVCRGWPAEAARTEEHTSELQSLMRISYAVFCLKKKKRKEQTKHRNRVKNVR